MSSKNRLRQTFVQLQDLVDQITRNTESLASKQHHHLAISSPSEVTNPMEGDICHVSDYEDSVKPISALGYNSLDLTPYSGYKIRLKRIGTLYNGDITVTKSDNTTETLNTATDLPRTYDAGVVIEVSAASSSVMAYTLGVYRLYPAEFEYVKGAWEKRGESLKYTVQALTDEKKQQARTNIGAASETGTQGYFTEDVNNMLAKEGDILYLAPQAYATNLQNRASLGNISIQGSVLRISRTAIFSLPFGKITITGSYPGLGSGTLGTIEEVEIDGFSTVCVIDKDNVRHPLYYGQSFNLSTVLSFMGIEMRCPYIAITETHEDGQTSMLTAVKIDDWREGSIKELRNGNWVDRLPATADDVPTQDSQNLVKSGGVYDAIAAKYTKPQTGIPATDLAAGVIPDISGKQNIYAVPIQQITNPKEGDITVIAEQVMAADLQDSPSLTDISLNGGTHLKIQVNSDINQGDLSGGGKINILGLLYSLYSGSVGSIEVRNVGGILYPYAVDKDGVATMLFGRVYNLPAKFNYTYGSITGDRISLIEVIGTGEHSILPYIKIDSVIPEQRFIYHNGDWVDIDTMFSSQQIQSDWDQADNTAKDYIKNKPTIPAVINTVNVTVGNNTGTPQGSGSVNGNVLSLIFDGIKGPAGASAIRTRIDYTANENNQAGLAWDTVHVWPEISGLASTLAPVPNDGLEHHIILVFDTPADASQFVLDLPNVLWGSDINLASVITGYSSCRIEVEISSASMIALFTKASLPSNS